MRDLLLGNQELLDEFAAEFKRELTRLRRQQHGDSRRLSRDLGEVERGIKRCLEFITGGDGEPGLVRDRLRQLEERRSEIIAEMKTRQGNQVVEIHPNLPDIYRRKVSNLQEVLEDETARPQAVEIIRSLIDRIEVRPGLPRGRCEVTLVGALAQILGFASQNTAGPTSSAHGGTFLMVAGSICSSAYLNRATKNRLGGLLARARNHLDLQLKHLLHTTCDHRQLSMP